MRGSRPAPPSIALPPTPRPALQRRLPLELIDTGACGKVLAARFVLEVPNTEPVLVIDGAHEHSPGDGAPCPATYANHSAAPNCAALLSCCDQ